MADFSVCGNIPLWAQLRDCKRDASDGTVEALAKIVPMLKFCVCRLSLSLSESSKIDSGCMGSV